MKKHRRKRRMRISVSVALGLFLLLAGGAALMLSGAPAAPQGSVEAAEPARVYLSPQCGCCADHADYLADKGFEVEIVEVRNPAEIKRELNIPQRMWSCHTTMVGEYFVEGHVPSAVIDRLLAEQPAIDGISLPGMPSGSPGMGGQKAEPWVVYAITDGESDHFTTY